MGQRKKIYGRVIALAAMSVVCLSGCTGVTAKKLVKEAGNNIEKEDSFANRVNLDIKVEGIVDTMEVSMEMDMESSSKPRAGHAKGTAHVNMHGAEVSSEIEIYQVTEGEEFVTYSSIYDQWTREAAPDSASITVDENFFHSAQDAMQDFHVAKETVEVEGKQCYQMYGNIPCRELTEFLGKDMIYAFGLLELPDMEKVEEMEIPVTLDIYKDEILPARLIVDMREAVNDLYASLGETEEVDDFTIQLIFKDYGQISDITVPREIKENAG